MYMGSGFEIVPVPVSELVLGLVLELVLVLVLGKMWLLEVGLILIFIVSLRG